MEPRADLPLLVPVQVEALVVNNNDRRTTTWSVSARTYSGSDRLLPIDPPPFATGNDQPRTGVTLHWLLPDALTVARWHDVAAGATELRAPHVPDRWLVVRTGRLRDGEPASAPLPARAWVVESDHAGPDGTNPFPVKGGAIDHLGRSTPLDDWPEKAGPASQRAVRLTALGPVTTDADGQDEVHDLDPAYAASVADIDNVLSFHDDLVDVIDRGSGADPAAVLSYAVIGWYAEPHVSDPMVNPSRLGRDLADLVPQGAGASVLTAEAWNRVMDTLEWSVGDAYDLERARVTATGGLTGAADLVPTRTILHGMVCGVGWTGLDGPAQPYTGGPDSAFAGSAIHSRAGWLNPEPDDDPHGFGDIEGGPSLADATELRQVGGQASAPAGTRSLFPHLAIGASPTDALAALLEFLLGQEGSLEPGDDPSRLSALFLALEHDLLHLYDVPGGIEELDRRLHQEGFVPRPGGHSWTVVLRRNQGDPEAGDAGHRPEGDDLLLRLDDPGRPSGETATEPSGTSLGLVDGLAHLNRLQDDLETAEALARATRRELYALWWKSRRHVDDSEEALVADRWEDSVTDEGLARRLNHLQTTAADANHERDSAGAKVLEKRNQVAGLLASEDVGHRLAELLGEHAGTLELVEVPRARFFAPADPVILISGVRASPKHGGDGRYTDDGSLLVRFGGTSSGAPGQALRMRIDETTSLGTTDLTDPRFGGLHRLLDGTPIPRACEPLLGELVLLDPGWSQALAALASTRSGTTVSAEEVRTRQRALWGTPTPEQLTVAAQTRDAGFVGVRPSPVAVEVWAPPWRPVYLAWRTTWYSDDGLRGSGAAAGGETPGPLGDWVFDGQDLRWCGHHDRNDFRGQTVQGRCLLSGSATESLQDSIDALSDRLAHAAVDPQQNSAADLQARRQERDAMRSALDTVKQQLASADILAQAMTGFHGQLVQRDATQFREAEGRTFERLEDVEREAPMPYGDVVSGQRFHPLRGGHARLRRAWVVDAFGQVFDVIHEQGQTDQSFVPLRGRGLAPAGHPQRTDTQLVPFAPRLVQPSRLSFRFPSGPTPVSGWLLPNHLDGSLSVSDHRGGLLGAVLPWHGAGSDERVRWEPAPGAGGASSPAGIEDDVLRRVVQGLFLSTTEGPTAFSDFLQAVDRTLWTTDPLGRRGDTTSVLLGRPIAVVRAQLCLELDGPGLPDQQWRHSLTSTTDEARTAGVTDLLFRVRLGVPGRAATERSVSTSARRTPSTPSSLVGRRRRRPSSGPTRTPGPRSRCGFSETPAPRRWP